MSDDAYECYHGESRNLAAIDSTRQITDEDGESIMCFPDAVVVSTEHNCTRVIPQ
jgi:hypothetical protein